MKMSFNYRHNLPYPSSDEGEFKLFLQHHSEMSCMMYIIDDIYRRRMSDAKGLGAGASQYVNSNTQSLKPLQAFLNI
uniref:Uncharacterized protein n=1 Tax=Oryza glumipatula TaxID=40148 RepID=A0A0E0B7S7_9ORYZ